MQMLLAQLNSVHGVVGSLVCDAEGQMVAHAFPSLFDAGMLAQAARVLSESAAPLETATGSVRLLDLRYDDARIVIRPLAHGTLLFLCAVTVNLQPLAISTSVVAPKIDRLLSGASPAGQSGLYAAPPTLGSSGLASATAVVLPNLSGLGWSMPDSRTPPPGPPPAQLFIPPPDPVRAPAPAPAPAPEVSDVSEVREVSEVYTTLEKIDAVIARRGLDRFKTRGAIAMKAGFGLGAIDADSPDDPQKLKSLRAAAAAVLGEKV